MVVMAKTVVGWHIVVVSVVGCWVTILLQVAKTEWDTHRGLCKVRPNKQTEGAKSPEYQYYIAIFGCVSVRGETTFTSLILYYHFILSNQGPMLTVACYH